MTQPQKRQLKSARQLALSVLVGVVKDGQSTGQTLPAAQQQCKDRDIGLLQQLVLGSLQHWFGLQDELRGYLQKPLKAKDADIQCLLTLGLFQLRHTRIPAHAAISETVNLCPKRKQWARGLCNAIFRRASEAEAPTEQPPDLPHWLSVRIKKDWPEQWQQIAAQSNQAAGITLRATTAREGLLAKLAKQDIKASAHPVAPSAIQLHTGLDVTRLPGFDEGEFVVQDGAAQLAAELLAPENGKRILDACAAPGGKTTHLLQLAPGAHVTALDSEAKRLERVSENLLRLKQNAEVVAADARSTEDWWDGKLFDRILLDAPCSATGVIRRHPDIKLLRRNEDIEPLVALQKAILENLWTTLKPGGRLLYCTCSILKAENSHQIQSFLQTHSDAELLPISSNWGTDGPIGKQLFPGDSDMDGFYYCTLQKHN